MRLPCTLKIERTHWLARLLCHGDALALILKSKGHQFDIVAADGTVITAEVDDKTSVFAYPPLVVLHYRTAARSGCLVLPQTALGREPHRRLRVWLCWQPRK